MAMLEAQVIIYFVLWLTIQRMLWELIHPYYFGVNLNFFFRGAICMLLSKHNIRYKFLSPSEWKSYVTGMRGGRPTKAMKQAQGASANKTIITDKLKERYGITFPEKIMINGKMRKFKYDVSDAIGIGFCGIHSNFPSARFPVPAQKI